MFNRATALAPLPRRATARLCLLITSLGACILASAPLQAQPEMNLPGRITYVYRVDTRPPAVVFRQGFRTEGRNVDLIAHVTGESCGAGNDAWVSTTSSIAELGNFVSRQLNNGQLSHTEGGVLNAWLYAIRVDHTFIHVANSFQQAIAAADTGTRGYAPVHGPILRQLMYLNSIGSQAELVSLHSIHPSRIQTASSLVYNPTAGSVTISEGAGTTNAHFVEPGASEQFENQIDDEVMRTLLPPISISHASFNPQVGSCFQTCDNATNSQRTKRSASSSPMAYCAAAPSKAQMLIGGED